MRSNRPRRMSVSCCDRVNSQPCATAQPTVNISSVFQSPLLSTRLLSRSCMLSASFHVSGLNFQYSFTELFTAPHHATCLSDWFELTTGPITKNLTTVPDLRGSSLCIRKWLTYDKLIKAKEKFMKDLRNS